MRNQIRSAPYWAAAKQTRAATYIATGKPTSIGCRGCPATLTLLYMMRTSGPMIASLGPAERAPSAALVGALPLERGRGWQEVHALGGDFEEKYMAAAGPRRCSLDGSTPSQSFLRLRLRTSRCRSDPRIPATPSPSDCG